MSRVGLAVIVIATVIGSGAAWAVGSRAAWTTALVAGQVNAAEPLATNGAVQCSSSTPTVIPAAASNMNGRAGLSIQNLGPNAIWVGYTTAATTTALGTKVSAGSTLTIALSWNKSLSLQQVYCLAETANQTSPADTRWMQLR